LKNNVPNHAILIGPSPTSGYPNGRQSGKMATMNSNMLGTKHKAEASFGCGDRKAGDWTEVTKGI